MLSLNQTDFELLGLPQRFELQRAELDARWKAALQLTHPDRFAVADAQSQRQSMQWSVRLNEAYQRLKDPLARAAYLCQLHGVDVSASKPLPTDFLVQQMRWRETLDEASGPQDLLALADEVRAQRHNTLVLLGELADERGDFVALGEAVRGLMFVQRFWSDLERRLDAANA